MATRGFDQKLIQLIVLTAITVVVWIGVDIYRALTKTVEPTVTPEQLRALSPQLDLEFMQKLKSRGSPTQEDLANTPDMTKFSLESPEKISTGGAQNQ
jgi:hypothetical protein